MSLRWTGRLPKIRLLELAGDFLDPIVAGQGVGTERLDVAFPVVVIERAMQAERGGIRRVNQAGGIAGAHLEQHAHLEFGQRLPAQKPVYVVVGVAGGDDMKSLGRAFADEIQQRGGGIGSVFGVAAGKAEFILLPQLLVILQAVNQHEIVSGRLGAVSFLSSPRVSNLRPGRP